jgi:hypothetical protein
MCILVNVGTHSGAIVGSDSGAIVGTSHECGEVHSSFFLTLLFLLVRLTSFSQVARHPAQRFTGQFQPF